MSTRLDDVPVIRIEESAIEGPRYNRVRLALLRLENPLRLSLTGLKNMDMLIDETAWVCVDPTLYDLPVLAWTDFDVVGRDTLHLPVHCKRYLYHSHANIIVESVLSTTDRLLAKRLSPRRSKANKVIRPLTAYNEN